MQVETYEVISDDPSQGDNALVNELESPEAVALIESLGLTGQRSLLVESKETGAVVRSPYRQMTQAEFNIYRTVLPRTVELTEYDDGPIPLRVLQVAAHARELFPRIEVWYEAGSRDDPLLLGCDSDCDWRVRVRHMLARWGDVLLPLEDLTAKAAMKLRSRWTSEIADAIEVRQAFIRSIDSKLKLYLQGESVVVPM